MRNQGMIFIALLIILAGVLMLLGNLFDINFWAICFPAGLILLGIFVLFRPRMVGPDTQSHVILIGEVERSGEWEAGNEETIGFIADVTYDLTKATIPEGETRIRHFGFVGDYSIYMPEEIGVAVNASSFVTNFKLDGNEEEVNILSALNWQSDNYKLAEKRVRFELTQFVGEIKLRRF